LAQPHLLDDLCASRVQLPLQQINRAHDLTVRRKTFDGRYLLVGNIETWRLTGKFEGLNFSFWCVVCFLRTCPYRKPKVADVTVRIG
jgi:hypothetical protein